MVQPGCQDYPNLYLWFDFLQATHIKHEPVQCLDFQRLSKRPIFKTYASDVVWVLVLLICLFFILSLVPLSTVAQVWWKQRINFVGTIFITIRMWWKNIWARRMLLQESLQNGLGTRQHLSAVICIPCSSTWAAWNEPSFLMPLMPRGMRGMSSGYHGSQEAVHMYLGHNQYYVYT